MYLSLVSPLHGDRSVLDHRIAERADRIDIDKGCAMAQARQPSIATIYRDVFLGVGKLGAKAGSSHSELATEPVSTRNDRWGHPSYGDSSCCSTMKRQRTFAFVAETDCRS